MFHTAVLIGIIVFSTFFALIFSSEATSYLYNQTWLANDKEIPECLLSAPTVMNCPQTDGEYLSGLFWWSNSVGIVILIMGALFAVIIYKKRPVARTN
jgi:hypothetical protein